MFSEKYVPLPRRNLKETPRFPSGGKTAFPARTEASPPLRSGHASVLSLPASVKKLSPYPDRWGRFSGTENAASRHARGITFAALRSCPVLSIRSLFCKTGKQSGLRNQTGMIKRYTPARGEASPPLRYGHASPLSNNRKKPQHSAG